MATWLNILSFEIHTSQIVYLFLVCMNWEFTTLRPTCEFSKNGHAPTCGRTSQRVLPRRATRGKNKEYFEDEGGYVGGWGGHIPEHHQRLQCMHTCYRYSLDTNKHTYIPMFGLSNLHGEACLLHLGPWVLRRGKPREVTGCWYIRHCIREQERVLYFKPQDENLP